MYTSISPSITERLANLSKVLGFVLSCSFESNCSVTLWTTARQASLSAGFSRQEYWSGFSFPPPEESSWFRNGNCISWVSCTGRQLLYHPATTAVRQNSDLVVWSWRLHLRHNSIAQDFIVITLWSYSLTDSSLKILIMLNWDQYGRDRLKLTWWGVWLRGFILFMVWYS